MNNTPIFAILLMLFLAGCQSASDDDGAQFQEQVVADTSQLDTELLLVSGIDKQHFGNERPLPACKWQVAGRI